jgi:hypothetical protein
MTSYFPNKRERLMELHALIVDRSHFLMEAQLEQSFIPDG